MSFKKIMIVNSIHFTPFYNTSKPKQQPSFEAKLPIDLNYIIENRAHLLPQRILENVTEIVASKPEKLPTLKEVHLRTYAPLMECNNLEEAQKLFPEFEGIKEANISFKRITGNIKKLQQGGFLKEGFSLKVLQEIWCNLKNQDEIAQQFGLKDRSAITWVLQKIGFVNYNTNYKTLLMSSDPETRATIAGKTIAWNASHPDLMRARNKKAAQSMKKPENREAHSKRMKQHFIEHPERREQVSKNSIEYWSDPLHRIEHSNRSKKYHELHPEKAEKSRRLNKAAWDLIPEAREIMSTFFKDYVSENKILGARLKYIFSKRSKGKTLTEYDTVLLRKFNKACFEAHPELKEMISKAHKQVREDNLK